MKANKFIDEFVLCPLEKKIYQLTSDNNCCPACGEIHKPMTHFTRKDKK